MDAMVLEAQKWVNATYSFHAGYKKCPENGKTGWATMFSLTRGLQHELGISILSDSFGPGTLSALTNRGGVKMGETTANIVKIAQAACYCKGYDGGGIDGIFDSALGAGIAALMTDAGIEGYDFTIQPKVFKALLTMDAYVVVPGGKPKIRDIQRWLNGRYYKRASFYVGPADGIYSRDVQKSLMRALQYEFGMSDEDATGNFGLATQRGLMSHPVGQGDSGIFVQLFSAACVFNGLKSGDAEASFVSTYDSTLKSVVSAFQKFSALDNLEGQGNFTTWCQLLVSMGDPDRAVSACDTRFEITLTRGKRLKAAGYNVVGRYLDEEVLDPTKDLNKEIQPGELQHIFDSGMRVFPISQYNARKLVDFTYSEGYRHASKAHDRAANVYKFDRGTVIYFAVDYDATDPEIASNIIPYFHGIQAALTAKGKRYVAGVYGSRNVCTRVSDEAFTTYSFVSGMSWGFSGNLGVPMPKNWSFTQIKEFKFGLGETDPFDLDRDAMRGNDLGVGRDGVGGTDSPIDAMLNFIDTLYAAAKGYGKGNPNELVCEYLRHPQYNTLSSGFWVLLYEADQEWIDYAQKAVGRRIPSFSDPMYGTSLNLDHLGACANTVIRKGNVTGGTAARGDFAGWGGDLCTFYVEWRHSLDSYASAAKFCEARLAKVNTPSSFGFGDLIEDVDGYLIAAAAGVNTKPINQVFRSHYAVGPNAGYLSRIKDFYNRRYNGSMSTVSAAAKHMIAASLNDTILQSLRQAIYHRTGAIVHPADLAADQLDAFVKGYADAIQRIMGQENSRRAKLLSSPYAPIVRD